MENRGHLSDHLPHLVHVLSFGMTPYSGPYTVTCINIKPLAEWDKILSEGIFYLHKPTFAHCHLPIPNLLQKKLIFFLFFQIHHILIDVQNSPNWPLPAGLQQP